MRRGSRVAIAVVALPVVAVAVLALFVVASTLEDSVTEGSAYGFTIGHSHAQVYRSAQNLLRTGEVASLHRGRGSALTPFDSQSPETAFEDPYWKVVVDPTWWNNSIALTFEGDHLSEIYRFRVCCELP